MSNSSYGELAKARRNWKDEHLSAYLRSGGAEGHIMDVTDIGGHKFTTMLLLKYVGRKSGKTMITPLIYGDIGGEVVIVASKGGADHHPAWYLNVKDSKELSFQIATQAYRATWREPQRLGANPRCGTSWSACSRRTRRTRPRRRARFRS